MEFTGERFIPGFDDRELELEHTQRYQAVLELVKDKIVLDAACGEGYGTHMLSSTATTVVGVDIDNKSIKHAVDKYGNEKVKFITSSIENLPFEDKSMDVVVSFETLEHVDADTQQIFIKEIKRVLKDEGILVISTPNKLYYSDLYNYINPFHKNELYKEQFVNLLDRHFINTIVYSQRFEVASIIDSVSQDNYINLNLGNDILQEKYMIAVCSDTDQTSIPTLFSIKTNTGKYTFMNDRINKLQDEIQERNEHIKVLDKELKFLRYKYSELERLGASLDKSEHEVKLYKQKLEAEKEKSLRFNKESEHEINENKNLIFSYTKEIQNLNGHVQLLLEQERRLNQIYNSEGWKLLRVYYSFRDKLIPENSKRKVLFKLLANTVRNPKLMFSKLNKENVKKLEYYMKSEDSKQLENRINNYMERHSEGEATELKLYKNKEFNHIEFESSEDPLVSIIIPVYNQWDYTYSCLASIKENTENIPFEIIIADDMSTDETTKVNNYISNIRVVRDGENRGFLLNCNNAAKHAKGKYIFFLNNDTNVQVGWLDSLLRIIETDETVGMVGSKLVYPDGRQQEAGGIIWNDASGWNYGRLGDPDQSEFNYVKEVDYISGAAILIRRNLWEQLGGFDERYVPAYFEDTDLAFEIRRLGYRVIFQPQSVIVHFEGVSHGTDTNSGVKMYQVENKKKFLDKWKNTLTQENFSNSEHVFWARDRSRYKKTVVMVDHYVPHYDKDAGGRCTYFYIKLMVSMGYNVIFIGDNFYRHEPYTCTLQQLGVEVIYGDLYAKNINQWIKENGKYFDYVYLNRPHISIKYMEIFKKYTKAKVIYFGHDLHYLRELRNYELTQNPALLRSSEEWKEMEFKLFKLADVIHVVGSYEQEVLARQFPEKTIRNIPLYPYEELYGESHSIPEYKDRKDLLFVGGFNHKPNYDAVNWFIDEIFPQIKENIPDIRLHIVGSNPPDDIKQRSSESILVTGYISDEELERYYELCRVVIVPLRFGAGVKGKVVEALNYQVPVVTTLIGAEGLFDYKETMAIAESSEDFRKAVVDIYNNESSWRAYSVSSGEYIKKYFTVKAAQGVLELDMGK
ncbi:glycosyltransferase [Paenibacillus sp. GYB006]|uniref:glycosyltransferase n=1 Tax=Paenibacillus sp. GYB006 TaxID=2994394 RepID=UPI002F962287